MVRPHTVRVVSVEQWVTWRDVDRPNVLAGEPRRSVGINSQETIMLKFARQTVAGFFVAASLAVAAPAFAQIAIQDGLVNVAVGDVTILEDVNIGVAAQVAANICGVKVGPVAVLGQAVDRSGATRTV